jgi:putative membrane protein
MRNTLRAIVMVSLLIAAVLVLNTLVGAQDNRNPNQQGTAKEKTDKSSTNKTGHPEMSHQDMNKPATGNAAGALSSSDRKFVMEAAHGGIMEVELGRLATQKAASDDVKQFGQRMVDDHSKANEELMTLASSKGIMLPKPGDLHMTGGSTGTDATHHGSTNKEHDKMMKEAHKVMSKLSALSGADFDREYMKMMVEDHTKDVGAFEKQSARGDDADLKAWAAAKLPTLREHLQLARDTNAKVNGKTTTGTSK